MVHGWLRLYYKRIRDASSSSQSWYSPTIVHSGQAGYGCVTNAFGRPQELDQEKQRSALEYHFGVARFGVVSQKDPAICLESVSQTVSQCTE